jgi:DNA-binding PadR family transcriptional regulator
MVDAVLHPCKTNAAMADSHPRALTLSPKELLILDLLRGDDLYGLQLVAASAGRLKRGTVYVTLGRMEEKGYITSTLEAAPSGLPRRIYATTPLGRRMFAAWTSGAKQLVPELGR